MSAIQIIEHQSHRVLTTAQIADGYETTPETISNNFNRNRDRYIEGKHFHCLEGEAKREFADRHQFDDSCKKAAKLYLWTEKGALLHAKSLNTDRAWTVYDELVESYFSVRLQKPLSPLEILELQTKAMRDIEGKLTLVEHKVENIGDVIALNTQSWRRDAHVLIVRMAQKMGGNEYIEDLHKEIFKLIDSRAGTKLDTRLTNKRKNMSLEGVCKSKRDKLTRIDVIADDKKLIEIYVAIVKEMAVKYGIANKSA